MIEVPARTFRVFGQGSEPRLAVAAWRRNAERFFECTLEAEEATDSAARIVVSGARRVVIARMREDSDLTDALADETARGNGLYDLAERRCNVVFLVEREGADEHASLVLAAVIASVALGPILGDGELFGVRTARAKIEALGAPYR